MSSPAHAVLVVLLILLHFAFRPVLISWTYGPDLLAGALLLGALHLRAGPAAGLGFALGLLEASMALTGMGAIPVVYTLAGYGAARSRDLLYSDSPRFVPTFLFLGVWAIHMATAFTTGQTTDVWFGLVVAPVSSLATALVCWLADRAVSYFFG